MFLRPKGKTIKSHKIIKLHTYTQHIRLQKSQPCCTALVLERTSRLAIREKTSRISYQSIRNYINDKVYEIKKNREIGKDKYNPATFFRKKSYCPLKIVRKKVLAPQNMVVEKCCCPPFSFGKKYSGPPFFIGEKKTWPPFFRSQKKWMPPFSPVEKSHSPPVRKPGPGFP